MPSISHFDLSGLKSEGSTKPKALIIYTSDSLSLRKGCVVSISQV